MTTRRYAQTSTLLQNGGVLITGGFSFDSSACDQNGNSPAVASAEIYDPSNGSFAPTGSMAEVRGGHTATLLTNGKVLIAGGDNTEGDMLPFFLPGDSSVTAEVYDSATGRFTFTGNMVTPRVGQTATLLVNGDVLIAGGWSASQNASIAAAELYHPATGAFTPTGSMNSPRTGHTATLLPDGKVLIAGGAHDRTLADSDSAEIYDPATGSFMATGSMAEKRCSHTATLLPNGTVLLVGGGSVVTEIYDPSTGSFVLSGLTELDRSGHSATLLQNGNVLVVGGWASPTTAELYQ
jgi:WD40 repeat protein